MDLACPRVYASFAEFECDERARLGLDPLQALTVDQSSASDHGATCLSPTSDPAKRTRWAKGTSERVTTSTIREEGVLEIGCALGSSVLFVRTRMKIHLLHASWVPDRKLDAYSVKLAVNLIENCGQSSYEAAQNLGVSEPMLRQALIAAGHDVLVAPRRRRRKRDRSAVRQPDN